MVKVESAVPLYKQIVHDLVSRIESGVYSEGDKLPTETELMELVVLLFDRQSRN